MKLIRLNSLVAIVLLSGCVLHKVDGQDADFSVNVAYGKPATQSSTYLGNTEYKEPNKFPYNASLAVDGITTTNFHHGSCSHTVVDQPDPWWEVDLQGLYDVSSIKIYQRSDANQTGLDGFVIRGMQKDANYLTINHSGPYAVGEINISLQPKRQFKAIRIQIDRNNAFICLCEVQVFAEVNMALGKPAVQSSTYYGTDNDHRYYIASLAVDGNTETQFSYGSCSQTIPNEMNLSWWKVKLNGHFPVIGLRIYQRSDHNQDWLDGYRLSGRQGEGIYENIPTPRYTMGPITLTLSPVKIFSEIKIELNGNGRKGICLCEVQVFTDIDECTSIAAACHNHGQCSNTDGGFSCHCDTGYTGTRCESDIDECTTIATACHNHGQCSNTDGGFSCQCDTGYKGIHCESDIDECTMMASACHYHGQCSNTDGGFSCHCDTGYTGTHCESAIECPIYQLENGNIIAQKNGDNEKNYTYCATLVLNCNQGYQLYEVGLQSTTTTCQSNGTWTTVLHCEDVNECSVGDNACNNNGKCTNNPGSFKCECHEGYNGKTCNEDRQKDHSRNDSDDHQQVVVPIAILLPLCLILIVTNTVTCLRLRRYSGYEKQQRENITSDVIIAQHFPSGKHDLPMTEKTSVSHWVDGSDSERTQRDILDLHDHNTGQYDELQKNTKEMSEYDELNFKRETSLNTKENSRFYHNT